MCKIVAEEIDHPKNSKWGLENEIELYCEEVIFLLVAEDSWYVELVQFLQSYMTLNNLN